MMTSEEIDGLKSFQARSIIEALRKGSVPADYVPFFTVGRDNWIKFIEDDLENYIAKGGAKVRFIRGDYGDGKTHFMSIVRHLALRQGFAVSFVVLTREVPIHKFEAVYQAIVRQLRGNFEGVGIRNLLNQWLDGLEQQQQDSPSPESLADLGETLRNLPGMNVNFANALISLAHNRFLPLMEGEAQEERTAGREILHQTPLKAEELVSLGQCLRHIHQIAYRWDAAAAVSDKILLDICQNQKKMGLLSEVRLFVKQVVRLLDMAEQGEIPAENLDLGENIIASQQEMEQEKLEQLQPSWDK